MCQHFFSHARYNARRFSPHRAGDSKLQGFARMTEMLNTTSVGVLQEQCLKRNLKVREGVRHGISQTHVYNGTCVCIDGGVMFGGRALVIARVLRDPAVLMNSYRSGSCLEARRAVVVGRVSTVHTSKNMHW